MRTGTDRNGRVNGNGNVSELGLNRFSGLLKEEPNRIWSKKRYLLIV